VQPDMRKSLQVLPELLMDDFVEFGSSDRIFDKNQILAALHSSPPLHSSTRIPSPPAAG
jgi:hypothetical protein